MDTMSALLKGITKSYLYTHLARDVAKFLRSNLSQLSDIDIDLDRGRLLRKAGLTTYSPSSNAMLIIAGAIAGAGAALLLAPKTGSQLRSQVKDRATTWFRQAEGAAEDSSSQSLS